MDANLKPLISVIINCYNGEKFLREAIDSVVNQTYENWEIIFWDNQSTDNTKYIVESYLDKRICYFYSPRHTPLGEARNLAMQHAHGQLICFLDSDDIWSSTFLETIESKYYQQPNLGLIYCDYTSFGYSNIHNVSSAEGIKTFNTLLENYDIGMSSAAINKSVLNKYNIKFNNKYQLIEDFDFFLNITRHSTAYHIKKKLVKYRVYADSMSNRYNFWHIEILDYYNGLLLNLTDKEKKECDNGLKRVYQMYLNRCYLDAYFSGARLLALKHLFKTNYSTFVKFKFFLKSLVGYKQINNFKELIKFNKINLII